jgi:hypothetical protein
MTVPLYVFVTNPHNGGRLKSADGNPGSTNWPQCPSQKTKFVNAVSINFSRIRIFLCIELPLRGQLG